MTVDKNNLGGARSSGISWQQGGSTSQNATNQEKIRGVKLLRNEGVKLNRNRGVKMVRNLHSFT